MGCGFSDVQNGLAEKLYFDRKAEMMCYDTGENYEEGWGIAACEAMACGLSVVAYDLPPTTFLEML